MVGEVTMVRKEMMYSKPGHPIARQRGNRVVSSFLARVKCAITRTWD